jgi:hypothetical protein
MVAGIVDPNASPRMMSSMNLGCFTGCTPLQNMCAKNSRLLAYNAICADFVTNDTQSSTAKKSEKS